ncbi:MAG: TRAP transporter small permease [Myxococcota bacterium]|nr:TRAP transporter small permease [Myxococcota bacterium]
MAGGDPAGSDSSAVPWGRPLVRIDAAWQTFEARVCATVLLAETVSLTVWIALKGLSSDFTLGGNAAGLVVRSTLSAVLLGVAAHLATRKGNERIHRVVVSVGVIVGLIAGRFWARAGVHWSSNLLNWLQNASSLMLIGGLRGLATRLTLWLALLGASLATSRGKHIHVDVLIRYVPRKLRAAAAILGWLAAAAVCVVAAVGFVDYICIASFRAPASRPCPEAPTHPCDTSGSERLAVVWRAASADVFLLARQASLDIKSLPHVILGEPYDQWMTASEWNTWLDGSDWAAHFDKGAVDALHMDPSTPDATRMPQVNSPGTGDDARGLLIRELNFVFPFGLLMVGLKFILRVLLVATGAVRFDPDAELDDEALTRAHDRQDEAQAPLTS